MSNDRIAALHVLVSAEVGQAKRNIDELERAMHVAGKSMSNSIKQAADGVTYYDKELEKLTRSVTSGRMTDATKTMMGQLSSYYGSLENPHVGAAGLQGLSQYYGFEQSRSTRQSMLDYLSRLQQSRELPSIPKSEWHGPAVPSNFFSTVDPTWHGPAFHPDMIARGVPDQYTYGQLHGPPEFIPNLIPREWHGPAFHPDMTARGVPNQYEYGQLHGPTYRPDLMPWAGGPRQPSFQGMAAASGWGSHILPEEAWFPAMQRAGSVADEQRPFAERIKGLEHHELKNLKEHFKTLGKGGQDIAKEMAMLDREMADASMRMGQGSGMRKFRYASQNIAFGFEDAVLSYEYGGLKGAFRAGANNMTAIMAATIPNPFAMTAAIVGSTIGAAVIPSLLEGDTRTIGNGSKATMERMDWDVRMQNALQGGNQYTRLRREAGMLDAEFVRQRRTANNSLMSVMDNAGNFGRFSMRVAQGSDYVSGVLYGMFGGSPEYGRANTIGESFERYEKGLTSRAAMEELAKKRADIRLLMAEAEASEQFQGQQDAFARMMTMFRRNANIGRDGAELTPDAFENQLRQFGSGRMMNFLNNSDFTPRQVAKLKQDFFDKIPEMVEDRKRLFEDQTRAYESLARGLTGQVNPMAALRERFDSVDRQIKDNKFWTPFQKSHLIDLNDAARKEALIQAGEPADDLGRSLRGMINPAVAFSERFDSIVRSINKDKMLTVDKRTELLNLTEQARNVALRNLVPAFKPPNMGMDVGSMEDAQWRGRIWSAASGGQTAIAMQQSQTLKDVLATLKSIEKKTKPPKVGNLK